MLSRIKAIYRSEGAKPFVILIGQLASTLVAIIKLASLGISSLTKDHANSLLGLLYLALAAVLAGAFYYSAKPLLTSSPMVFDGNGKEIETYMQSLIKKGGNVAVFSRTLSWAKSNAKLKELLLEKARDRSLTVVVPELFDLASQLKDAGAEVIVCKAFDRFKIRFTITNLGTVGIGAATGMPHDARVHVERFIDQKRQPVITLADTVLTLVRENEKLKAGIAP